MKKKLLYLLYSLLFLLIGNQSFGQAFTATYAFGSVATTTGTTDPTPVPTATGITFGSFNAVGFTSAAVPPVAVNPNAGSRFSFVNLPLGATNASDVFTGALDPTIYYEVIITPNAGMAVTLTSLTFTLQRSGTGIRQAAIRSSVDNFASNLPASITTTTTSSSLSVVPTNVFQVTDADATATDGCTITFAPGSFTNLTSPVKLRFYGFNAEGTGGTFSVDNVVVNGSASVAPPTLTTSVNSLDFGTTTIVGGTPATKTFTISGSNLTAGASLSLSGTDASQYLLSTDNGTTYAPTATIASAFTAAQTITVKFTPTGTTSTAANIVITSTNAATQNVALTGTGFIPAPTVTPSVTTLAFNTQTVSTTSSPALSYTLTGANLTAITTVAATGPFLVSKTATGGFASSVTFATTDFATTPPTVYVEFAPTVLGAVTGSITHTTAGAASNPAISLSGTGVPPNPALANNPSTLTFNTTVNTTSPSQTYALTGSNLTAGVTLTTAAPYAISKDGVTFSPSLTYLATDFVANQTVYVQFSPTTTGAANGTITETSTNATTQTVTLNGTGIAIPVLTATPATLAFGNQSITATSAGQTFTLTGANITVATTVTTAAPFAVSKDGVTYSPSISFSTTEIAAGPKVYVNFAPATIAPFTGTVTIATTGATNKTVALSGAGITPPNVAPTLNAIADQTVCYTSTPLNIALSNITPGPEATQSVVVSVSSNNAALFAQIGVFPILGTTTGTLSYTIANNASGTATVTVTVKDNGGTVNGGVDTYTRTFNITVNALPTAGITSDIGNTITLGSTANLTAAAGATTYAWTGTDIVSGQAIATLTVRPKATTTYTLVETNATGCTTTQTFVVTVNTFSPLVTNNILTPDGDGKNDTWIVHNIDYYPTSFVKVIDKAGKVVFSKTNYLNDWDGTYNGQPLTQGTYYYVIDLGTGAPKYTGYITLIRK